MKKIDFPSKVPPKIVEIIYGNKPTVVDGKTPYKWELVEDKSYPPTRWELGTCPACLKKDVELLTWNGEYLVCPACGFTDDAYRWEEPPNPLLKEEDILSLGWKITPDTTDYYLGKSYIKAGAQDICWYELRNDDADNVWAIQECDEEGNYIQEGEYMFFILKGKKDLMDLMRLMGLNNATIQ